MDTDQPFHAAVLAALGPARERLEVRPAIVLERIARGGGRTEWYCCADVRSLALIARRLSPGSVVSFYFDGRIARSTDRTATVAEVQRVLLREPDAVAGALLADGVSLDMQVIVTLEELDELLASIPGDEPVFHGAFPARDNGTDAVTVTLPDLDGVVRSHPH